MLRKKMMELLKARFRRGPLVLVRAPGRVNLIGEHTDYNDGFVMPAAIEPAIYAAGRRRKDRIIRVVAYDFGEEMRFEVNASSLQLQAPAREAAPSPLSSASLDGTGKGTWRNYVFGVITLLLQRSVRVSGVDILIHGDLPIGAGLSSSAALEIAVLKLLMRFWKTERLTTLECAVLAQKAEHEYAGTRCGIMDQLAVLYGIQGHALLIDCRSLEVGPVRLPAGYALLVADTGKRRELASSAYNKRREQCAEAARLLGVKSLRDTTLTMLELPGLAPLLARRAQHVIEENERVLKFAAALRDTDLEEAGRLMNASHASLRDLYEVSCPELDTMVELLQEQPGCLGARLTGAGFGGCAVALVLDAAIDRLVADVGESYRHITGIEPGFIKTRPAAAARARVV